MSLLQFFCHSFVYFLLYKQDPCTIFFILNHLVNNCHMYNLWQNYDTDNLLKQNKTKKKKLIMHFYAFCIFCKLLPRSTSYSNQSSMQMTQNKSKRCSNVSDKFGIFFYFRFDSLAVVVERQHRRISTCRKISTCLSPSSRSCSPSLTNTNLEISKRGEQLPDNWSHLNINFRPLRC